MSAVRPRAALAIESLPLQPLVLVLVGTDHHRFSRLVEWADTWGAAQEDVEVFVQHGSTPAPERVAGSSLLAHEQMQSLLARAAVVISHGGPATIMEARRAGALPVVVPRDPQRGEHVDEHQQLFSRRMGQEGMVRLCEDVEELDRVVRAALAVPESVRVSADAELARKEVSARRVGAVIGDVVDHARRRRAGRTRWSGTS